MVRKLSTYEKANKAFAQVNSVLHARIKERDEEIQSLKNAHKSKDDTIENQHLQIQGLMKNLINPPFIMEAAKTQTTLRQLEGQVKAAMQWIDKEKGKNAMLRAQLLLANRALSQFLKPTA